MFEPRGASCPTARLIREAQGSRRPSGGTICRSRSSVQITGYVEPKLNTESTLIHSNELICHLIDLALQNRPNQSQTPNRLVVGYSGGLDSTVLLHLAKQWQQNQPTTQLVALHINHQLQDQSTHWQQHCQNLCQQWQVSFETINVQVDQQSSLEQAARKARYTAFAQFVQPQDVLLLAHHRDDQVETLLQRLARGSGPLGLSAMSIYSQHHNMEILRPLLEQDRQQLENYAQDNHLNWVEDPSNQNNRHERNFLRNQLLPVWRQRKPQLNQTLARSARLCQESAQLLQELAQQDLGATREDFGLAMARLQPLNPVRQKNLLRYWIQYQGYSMPSEAVLNRVLQEVMPAANDANPQVEWGRVTLRRFHQVLYLVPDSLSRPPQGQIIPANTSLPYCLPFEFGQLSLLTQKSTQANRLASADLLMQPLTVGFRQGGERVKPVGRPTKLLKDWFQAYQVPPWLRSHWPILYRGSQIVGLPGLFLCEGFQAEPGHEGINIQWDWRLGSIESTS